MKNVQCNICPKECIISPGMSGDCRVRVNIDGKLIASTYGYPCAVHIDPVEKKPLFHFLPGTSIFSIATAGCNLHCKNCQNWQISQADPDRIANYYLPPEHLVKLTINKNCKSIAYTYTEPTIYFEYTLESAKLARTNGLKNVSVTAGYINPKPARFLYRYIDAANTDLKSFDNSFYKYNCDASLKPVLDTLVIQRELGVWLEITNLVIPTLNDDFKLIKKMCKWIIKNLGDFTPLHFSRFHPTYKLRNLPLTPSETLVKAQKTAFDAGLKYVYIGNLQTDRGETTICPHCHKTVINRAGYLILENNIKNSSCRFCGTKIEGVWQ